MFERIIGRLGHLLRVFGPVDPFRQIATGSSVLEVDAELLLADRKRRLHARDVLAVAEGVAILHPGARLMADVRGPFQCRARQVFRSVERAGQ